MRANNRRDTQAVQVAEAIRYQQRNAEYVRVFRNAEYVRMWRERNLKPDHLPGGQPHNAGVD